MTAGSTRLAPGVGGLLTRCPPGELGPVRREPGLNPENKDNDMKDKDFLRISQLEETLRPYRKLVELVPPRGGWIRAIREALGMSSRQLAKRLGIAASQSVDDMQEYEVRGTIKLQTLRKLANGLQCDLVYVLVPRKPLEEIRNEQARLVATRILKRVAHSMKLEDQAVSKQMEEKELDRRVEKLLLGNPKRLWD